MAARRNGGRLSQAIGSGVLALTLTAASFALVLATAAPRAEAAQTPTSCSSTVALTNGDFEQPVVPDNSGPFLQDSQVPGWYTSASDHAIELWSTPYYGVTAGSGRQFAELNANMASTLYQDVPTTPGQTLRWQLLHRGRAGTDVMAVVIGKPNTALVSQGNLTDGKTAWGAHSGTYTVPAGQTTTRFGFRAVSTATGDATVGNFLDGIFFGTGPCMLTTETVSTPSGGTRAQVGDVLTYTVTVVNGGGNPAQLTALSGDLPAGVTFVPGSIRVVNGSTTATRTDTAGDDQAEYDAATRTVTVRTGTGATASAGGSVPPGESRAFSYQARVDTAAAGSTITDDATTVFTDPLSGTRSTSRSATVTTTVDPAADLAVTVTRDTASLVAGQPAQYTAVTTNNGPSAATGTTLTATVPAALTGLTATTGSGTCTVSGTSVTCQHGTLAVGASATVTLTGTVPATEDAGRQYTVGAAVTGTRFDHAPGNNSASTTSSVSTSADLGVSLTSAPSAPVAGQDVTYTAVVTNSGPSTARGVRLQDPVPAGATDPRATVPGGTCTTSATAVQCSLPDLAPGASSTVTITLQLSPSGAGAADNSVSVTAPTPDPSAANNYASVHSTGAAVADVGITLDVSPSTLRPGDTFSFTVSVTNDGPSAATDVSLIPVLPPWVGIVTPPASPYCTPTGCVIPAMAPHTTEVFSGTAGVAADAPKGTWESQTTVTSSTVDDHSENDSDAAELTVELSSDLALSRTTVNPDGPGPTVAGGRVRETLAVTDDGPTRAETLVLREEIPAGDPVPTVVAGSGSCSYTGAVSPQGVAEEGGVVVCVLDQLAPGATWTVVLDTQLPSSYDRASFARTATVASGSPDPDPSDDTASDSLGVGYRTDLVVAQTTSTPAVIQTEEIRFRVTVTNAGPSDARDVLVRELPQPGVLVSTGIPSVGGYSPGSGNWRIPFLAVDDTAVLDIVATAQSDGSVVNEVSFVSAQGVDPDAGNDLASATVAVTAAVRSLTVTAAAAVDPVRSPPGVRAGDAIAYTYAVANTGNVVMTAIAVSDSMVGTASCPSAVLAVGAAMMCTADHPYLVTQGDVDNGHDLRGAGYAEALAPDSSAPLVFGPAADPVPVTAAELGLVVDETADWTDADGDGVLDPGETVVWSAVVTNTGSVTVSGLQVSGSSSQTMTCSATGLEPGGQATCVSEPYRVTAADAARSRVTDDVAATAASARDGALAPGTTTATVAGRDEDPVLGPPSAGPSDEPTPGGPTVPDPAVATPTVPEPTTEASPTVPEPTTGEPTMPDPAVATPTVPESTTDASPTVPEPSTVPAGTAGRDGVPVGRAVAGSVAGAPANGADDVTAVAMGTSALGLAVRCEGLVALPLFLVLSLVLFLLLLLLRRRSEQEDVSS